MIFADDLIILKGIWSGPLLFFVFKFNIIEFTSETFAFGKSNVSDIIKLSLILVILGWSLYVYIISLTVWLSLSVFDGLPRQTGLTPEEFFTIFV